MAEVISNDALEANYNLFYKRYQQALSALNKAISADENPLNTKRHVLAFYNKALREIQQTLSIRPERCLPSKRKVVEDWRSKLEKHVIAVNDRVAQLTAYLRMDGDDKPNSFTASSGPKSAPASLPSTSITQPRPSLNASKRQVILNGVNPKHGEDLLATVIDTTDVRMSDILGNEDAKRALDESVVFPTLNPQLFSGLRQPVKGILLFGPPGNGKTMLAKAVATESGCTFFNISASSIMSKWVGEGERLMQALFQMARNAQPSIIFIDELDSMLSERTENENGASRRVKTEFLLQFDGVATRANERVLVLGATNRPQELDDGVLRRFPRRIYIDLPDENARAALIKENFQRSGTRMNLSDKEIMDIARRCKHYSCSDLTALCREAAMVPLRGLSRDQLQRAKPTELRPICHQDLTEALNAIKASTNLANMDKLREFAAKFAATSICK